jgi:membrane associated rhomboid family serine protease
MASRTAVRTRRISFDFYITPGVQLLIIANVAVYILEAFIHYFGGVNGYNWLLKWFGLVPAGVIPLLRVWQPFTYLFLHDINSIWHIVLNMFTLWMFGREVELVWGRNRFLRYYFLTGVGAGILNVIVKTVPMFGGKGILLRQPSARLALFSEFSSPAPFSFPTAALISSLFPFR